MQIDVLIYKLMELQKLYPDAYVYFTDEINSETWETYLEEFYVDEEANEIEFKLTTNERNRM